MRACTCSRHIHVQRTCRITPSRASSASRARKTRTAALLHDNPFCKANAFTGVPATTIASRASAYTGFKVAARRDTHAQLHVAGWRVVSLKLTSKGLVRAVRCTTAPTLVRQPHCATSGRTTGRWRPFPAPDRVVRRPWQTHPAGKLEGRPRDFRHLVGGIPQGLATFRCPPVKPLVFQGCEGWRGSCSSISEDSVFRASVLSIVLTVLAGPNARVLCKAWCDPAEAAATGCHHKHATASATVTGTHDCGNPVLNGAALAREDVRRDVSSPDARHAGVVPHYPFSASTSETQLFDAPERGSPFAHRTLVTALRI